MATDASGTPSTHYSIPKLDTSADAPSGLGEDAIVDAIDAALFVVDTHLSGNIVNADIKATAAIAASKISGYPSDITKFLAGDGTWIAPAASASTITPGTANQVLVTNTGATAAVWAKLVDANVDTAAAITVSKLAGYPADATKFLAGDGTWVTASSGATVATTIGGLGAGTAGKLGLLRLGASPYDLIALIYDATYSKWVSEASWEFAAVSNGGVNSTYAEISQSGDQGIDLKLVPWKPLDTAGLKPQFRIITVAAAVSGDTGLFRTAWKAADVAAAVTSTTGITAGAQTGWTTKFARDTGWQDIAAGYTVKDFLIPTMQSATSSGTAGRASFQNTALGLRWVG